MTRLIRKKKGAPARKLLSRLEAAIGIEPMNKGFAVSPGSFLHYR